MAKLRNIVLDLDETLIYSSSKKDEDFDRVSNDPNTKKHYIQKGEYVTVERPGLQEFLDYVFSNYNVSIWTAATCDYALDIIEKIIIGKKENRRLDWIFTKYHCDLTEHYYGIGKKLDMYWTEFNIPEYRKDNTIIIDDRDDVIAANNGIMAEEFRGKSSDNFLSRLKTKIENYKLTENKQTPKPLMSKTSKQTSGMIDVITITFGDMAENHVGMEKIGKMVDEGQGFNYEDLELIKSNMESIGSRCELVEIKLPDPSLKQDKKAYILIIRDGVNHILGYSGEELKSEDMYNEQARLDVDKKVKMYGRIVNKNARWNLCFDDKSSEPDYEQGKGRVIAYKDVPVTQTFRTNMSEIFGEKAEDLKGEGNYYYDISKCGIGYHGDSERRKVVGVRLGKTMPIFYQWYYMGNPVGDKVRFDLNGGDVYVMSEKAVGTDWKKRNIPTLRHSAGCEEFTTVKTKK